MLELCCYALLHASIDVLQSNKWQAQHTEVDTLQGHANDVPGKGHVRADGAKQGITGHKVGLKCLLQK